MNDLRIIVTVKNAVMLRAMDAAGFETAAQLSRACGISQAIIGDYLALKLSPYMATGQVRPSIVVIAGALNQHHDDLFPAAFLHRALAKNKVVREVSSDDLPQLMGDSMDSLTYDPERSVMVQDAVAELTAALATLSPREQAVIKMVYGLDGNKTMTLDQVGEQLGVGRERVRQIILKGQRKMAHPSRNLHNRCVALLEQ